MTTCLRLLALIGCITSCVSLQAETRKWTNLSGQILEAELVSVNVQQRTLLLRLKDGKEFTIPIDQLSKPDREYAKNVFNSGGAGAANLTQTATDALPVRYRHRMSEATRLAALQLGGGTAEMEAAVIRSLDHFKTTQNADGSWSRSNKGGMTGFVLQCFLGHGEGADSAAYGDTVMKGLLYLIQLGSNNPQGMLTEAWVGKRAGGAGTYEHAIATCALGEAYVLARSGSKAIPGLRKSFEQAVQLIISQQNKRGSWTYGGDVIAYNAGSSGDDLSLAHWHFLALHVARESGLTMQGLDPCIQKAISYIEFKQTKDGGFGGTNRDAHYNQWSLTGGALAGLQYLGKPADHSAQVSKAAKFLTGFLAAEPPQWDKNCNLYCWFGYAEALVLSGDTEWKDFATQVMPQIVSAQNPDGSFKNGTPDWPAANAAETNYRQALCTLMLETFYRCPMK